MHELEVLLSRLKMEHLSYHVESLLEQAAKKELNTFICGAAIKRCDCTTGQSFNLSNLCRFGRKIHSVAHQFCMGILLLHAAWVTRYFVHRTVRKMLWISWTQ